MEKNVAKEIIEDLAKEIIEDIDFEKVSHVLMNCGWIPIDKGTYKETKVEKTLTSYFEIATFKSEGRLIIAKLDHVLALKFIK